VRRSGRLLISGRRIGDVRQRHVDPVVLEPAMLVGMGVADHRRGWPDHEQDGVPSPGGWEVPAGSMPGWKWTPAGGLRPRLERVPRPVRFWYLMPFIDRYAYVWMWRHGGWDVDAPPGATGPDAAGVREPLRPPPTSASGGAERIPAPLGGDRPWKLGRSR
jgi:hypothetical protein